MKAQFHYWSEDEIAKSYVHYIDDFFQKYFS